MKPKTREEHYLAKIAGEDVTVPEPKTRQEHYLKEIAENGGSGYEVEESQTLLVGEPGQGGFDFNYDEITNAYVAQYAPINKPDQWPDSMTVTFDGQTYVLPRGMLDGDTMGYGYISAMGQPDFEKSPIHLVFFEDVYNDSLGWFCLMIINVDGHHTVTVEYRQRKVATVSNEFKEAVAKSQPEPFVVTFTTDPDFSSFTADKSFADVKAALDKGQRVKCVVLSVADGTTMATVQTFNVNVSADATGLMAITFQSTVLSQGQWTEFFLQFAYSDASGEHIYFKTNILGS